MIWPRQRLWNSKLNTKPPTRVHVRLLAQNACTRLTTPQSYAAGHRVPCRARRCSRARVVGICVHSCRLTASGSPSSPFPPPAGRGGRAGRSACCSSRQPQSRRAGLLDHAAATSRRLERGFTLSTWHPPPARPSPPARNGSTHSPPPRATPLVRRSRWIARQRTGSRAPRSAPRRGPPVRVHVAHATTGESGSSWYLGEPPAHLAHADDGDAKHCATQPDPKRFVADGNIIGCEQHNSLSGPFKQIRGVYT